jgi:hypothetical protein
MGERSSAYSVLAGNLRERGHLEDPGADDRIILGLIFRKWGGNFGLDLSVLG